MVIGISANDLYLNMPGHVEIIFDWYEDGIDINTVKWDGVDITKNVKSNFSEIQEIVEIELQKLKMKRLL